MIDPLFRYITDTAMKVFLIIIIFHINMFIVTDY